MAWTSPRTWIAGELVTASMMNTHVRDNLSALYDDHGIFQNRIRFTSTITPTALSADANNYNPTGLATASVLRISTSGGTRAITGLMAQPEGTFLWLINVGASDILLRHDHTDSSDANRFMSPTPGASAGTITLTPWDVASLLYDTVISRWRYTTVGVT